MASAETTFPFPLTDLGEPSSEIHVDEEGDWYFQQKKIIRDDIIELFLDHLHRTSDGGYFIEWNNSRCILKPADTPFVISRVDRSPEGGILLHFRHHSGSDPLDPGTLRVGKANVLYCRIRNGAFPARFSRPAYYQMAEWIQEDEASGEFFVEIGKTRYPVRQ